MKDCKTLVDLIAHWAKVTPERGALFELDGGGALQVMTWAEYYAAVRDVAKGLIALGLSPGEGVAIVGENRREWVICQFAVSAAGGLLAPIYTTNTVEQVAYIIRNSKSHIAICDTAEQLAKYGEVRSKGLASIDRIVMMDEVKADDSNVTSFAKLIELGRAQDDTELDRRLAAVKDDDRAMLIYTSGTTGVPKGAIYTHRCMVLEGERILERYPELRAIEHPRQICYLPLCHAAEQAMTNFVGLRRGPEYYFCRDLKKLKDVLLVARPQSFVGVPRVWEKFEAALRAKFAGATGLKAKLLAWATRTELECFEESVKRNEDVNPFSRRLAHKLVIDKIKAALGLDALGLALTGAAPISRSTLEFFASLGIVIHEVYGMTETTAVATVSPYLRPRFGTVGRAIPGVEIRIADDGEILLRGETMIPGYLDLPEATAELWEGGWLHTGDLGQLDADGFLQITGRKKDLLITAGGKNVAPSEMEGYLQSIPGVGQAVVVGDAKPYLGALLVLDEEALPDLCKAADVPPASIESLAQDPKVRTFLEARVEKDCNAKVARFQTIKKFVIVPHAFSVEGGELTPTLKVRRNIVSEKYADLIASLYTSGDEADSAAFANAAPKSATRPRA